mgnify:CR=1 FL=1
MRTRLRSLVFALLLLPVALLLAVFTVLVAVIVVQVVARYAFNKGSITMEELQWHLYAIGFMLGISFTEIRERNVRIDVLAERFAGSTLIFANTRSQCDEIVAQLAVDVLQTARDRTHRALHRACRNGRQLW